jgi:hypothetical protein
MKALTLSATLVVSLLSPAAVARADEPPRGAQRTDLERPASPPRESLRLQLDVPRLEEPAVDPAALAAGGDNLLVGGIALSVAGDLLVLVGGLAWANARADHESCGAQGSSESWFDDGYDDDDDTVFGDGWFSQSEGPTTCHTVHDPASDIAPVVVGAGVVTAGVGLALVIAGATTKARARRLERASIVTTPYVSPTGTGFEAGVRIDGF